MVCLLFWLQEGEMYRDAVFNDTVHIVETEESFDGETYVACCWVHDVFVIKMLA